MSPAESVVGGVWGVEEWVLAACPVEFTRVDDDTSDGCAVAAEPLGE